MRTTVGTATLFVCLLVASAVPPVAGGLQAGATTIESVTYEGQAVTTTPDNGVLSLWQSESHTFSIRVGTDERVPRAEVCLTVSPSDGESQNLGCQGVTLLIGSDQSISVTVDPWPRDLTGNQTLRTVVRNQTTGTTLASHAQSVTILDRDADQDDDGLSNEAEVNAGTDMDTTDSDGDGVLDGVEVNQYDTSPTDPDSDADGLPDGVEVNRHHTDPNEADTDGDGLADGREVDKIGTVPTRSDTDGDGLEDGAEVDTYQTDPTTVDTDGDGLSDGTEVNEHQTNPLNSDTDDDGLQDGAEVTLYGTDPARTDSDGDSLSDAMEVNKYQTDPSETDTDGDGLEDGAEVNEHETDLLAADTDNDGVDDGTEIDLGSDPMDPADTATPGPVHAFVAIVSDHPFVIALLFALVAGIGVVVGSKRFGGRFEADPVTTRFDMLVDDVLADSDDEGAERDQLNREPDPSPVDETSDATSDSTEPLGESTPDISILTNEEQVQQLLDENDGRMLQSDIVEQADWSKATVSRVLSKMEEAGDVTRVDIGKGNLVARPGDEPANANSPFSE